MKLAGYYGIFVGLMFAIMLSLAMGSVLAIAKPSFKDGIAFAGQTKR